MPLMTVAVRVFWLTPAWVAKRFVIWRSSTGRLRICDCETVVATSAEAVSRCCSEPETSTEVEVEASSSWMGGSVVSRAGSIFTSRCV